MKRVSKTLLALACSVALFSSTAVAEDVQQIFKKVNELIGQENYSKAIEELAWAEKEIEKMHFKKIESFLPAQLQGFESKPVKAQSALGFTSLEKTYAKGGEKVKLSIAGTGKKGGAGGLAAFGRMAAMMGNQPGADTFRIDGLTANLQTQGSRTELSVFLDSGSVLKLESRKAKGETLKKMIGEIKVKALDSYLRGTS